jgi:hypothetical protein
MMVMGTLLFAGIVATILAVLGALWVYAAYAPPSSTTTGVTTSSIVYVVLGTLAAVLCAVLVVVSAIKFLAASLYDEEAYTPAPAPTNQ